MAKLRMSAVSFVAMGSMLLIAFLPRTVMAQGKIVAPAEDFTTQTRTGTVTVGGQLYSVTATTIPLQYFTNCYFITNGLAAQFPAIANTFTFANGNNYPNIGASDFNVSQYIPWVVNNNNTTNFVAGPDVVAGVPVPHSLGFTKVVGGGADIVISYTPQNNGMDPTKVNFVQGYVQSQSWVNNGALSTGTIDTANLGSPFYNSGFLAGTGTTAQNTVPLVSSFAMTGPPAVPAVPAWMVDIPGDLLGHGGAPRVFTSTVTFQAFIEATPPGTNTNVLYGGVQWGYTVTTFAVPEPATLTLLAEMVAMVSLGYFWRRRTERRKGT